MFKPARIIIALPSQIVIMMFALCISTIARAEYYNFANINIGQIRPGNGHVGVDIWWIRSNSVTYVPCHHADDIYYGACIMSDIDKISYYKVMQYSPEGNNFPYGVFIDNNNENYCKSQVWCSSQNSSSIQHNWANLVTGGALEIYPYDAAKQYNPYNNNVGGVRVIIDGFPYMANGGKYSIPIGDIHLPKIGERNVGRLNGFITVNGHAVDAGRVNLEIFQNGASRTSSMGYPLSGISFIANIVGGYYNTGALPSGSYKIYITDRVSNRKVILDGVIITYTYERLDFELNQRCFGQANFNCDDRV